MKIRAGILFALFALLFSILFGAAAGNGAAQVISKSLIMSLFFGIVGYGAFFVIQRFVPELFEALNAERVKDEVPAASSGTGEEPLGGINSPPAFGPLEGAVPSASARMEPPVDSYVPGGKPAFEPFTKDDFAAVDTFSPPKSASVGRHIIIDEKKIQYEPKLMAKAIKTMMKRDE